MITRQAKALLFVATTPLLATRAFFLAQSDGTTLSPAPQRRNGSDSRLQPRQSALAAAASAIDTLPQLLLDGETRDNASMQEKLRGKRVALYFGAGWCPMCTRLEPSLLQFQQACADSGKPIELVYVPSDRDAKTALQRASTMQMSMSVPFGDAAGELKQKYRILAGSESIQFGVFGRRSGVPALVVLSGETGDELEFLPAESQGVRALQAWPLEEESGVW